jgi:hypothetical protein
MFRKNVPGNTRNIFGMTRNIFGGVLPNLRIQNPHVKILRIEKTIHELNSSIGYCIFY